jgi:hypothetical protein
MAYIIALFAIRFANPIVCPQMRRCESGNDTFHEWAGTELTGMTLGSKPPMSDADVLPKTQWGMATRGARSSRRRCLAQKPAPRIFSRQTKISHRIEIACLHCFCAFCASWRQVEPRNSGLISRRVPDSSTNSHRVPHYHPTLAEIWTSPPDELAAHTIAVSFNIGTVCQAAGKRLRVKAGRVTPCAPAGESERARWQKSGGQRTARPTSPMCQSRCKLLY